MKGNTKIGITAEFVAIMKAKEDKNYHYFISKKAKRLYKIFNALFGRTLNKTFESRLLLSKQFDKLVYSESPKNIIDLGAGFSLRCFNEDKINYFDLDFPKVIETKKEILSGICKKEKKIFPPNYHLISADLLNKYSIKRNGKSVFFAEGVLSYFNKSEFDSFVKSLFNSMNRNDIFIYNERWEASHTNTLTYKFFRAFLSFISKSKSFRHFQSEEEIKDYFYEAGFSKVNLLAKGGFKFVKLTK
jgi:O-methyltransferase involved in polyketide biosynthesis